MGHVCNTCGSSGNCEDEKDSVSRGATVEGCGDWTEIVPICCICGESVAPGSGKFVNRVPQCDDLRTRVTNGYSHPLGDFICAECDSEDPEDAIGEGKNAYYIDLPSPWIRADSKEEAHRKWRRYFHSGHWSPEDESVDLAEKDIED